MLVFTRSHPCLQASSASLPLTWTSIPRTFAYWLTLYVLPHNPSEHLALQLGIPHIEVRSTLVLLWRCMCVPGSAYGMEGALDQNIHMNETFTPGRRRCATDGLGS